MLPIKSILRVTFFEIFLVKSVEFIAGEGDGGGGGDRTMLLVTVACKNMAYLLDIVVRMAFYSPKKANIGGHTFPDTSGSKE